MLVGPFTNRASFNQVTDKLQSLIDDDTLLIFSSDFCHWGKRFDYVYRYDKRLPIYASIEEIDRRGIELLMMGDAEAFQEYLDQSQNTICGRYPLILLLNLIKGRGKNFKAQLLHYAQSSQVTNVSDSSVSYAALMYTH